MTAIDEFIEAIITAYRKGVRDGSQAPKKQETPTPATPEVPEAPSGNGQSDPKTPLSRRECSILRGLTSGESNKTIALRLVITESTVKVHMKAILRKLRMKNRTEAALWARDNLPLINGEPIA